MEIITKKVVLKGITPIMFDRYAGNNNEQLPPMQKVYLGQDNKTLILPASNLSSFLSAQNTESATQRVLGRKAKTAAKACLSYVNISPVEIPFTREGQPLTIDNADLYIHNSVARVMKGKLAVPNPKERPVMPLPWELSFTLTILKNADISENILHKIFQEGGIAIGLGTYRGVFGKFVVEKWE